jgi:hypothetical protein
VIGDHNDDDNSLLVACHVIVEGGVNGAARGKDIRFLENLEVQHRLAFLGVEPVLFPDEVTGHVSRQDAESARSLLASLSVAATNAAATPTIILISPDLETYQAIKDVDALFWNQYPQVAIRKGPQGSVVLVPPKVGHDDDDDDDDDDSNSKQPQELRIPAATLMTFDKTPVNPTGAGNAYAGAFSALRSIKSATVSLEEAACIASAVGAVFCEYEHMPPWTNAVLARVRTAAAQVQVSASVQAKY